MVETAILDVLPSPDYFVAMRDQPLKAIEAEKRVRALASSGFVHFRTQYVARRQAERKIENIDIINVLLRGKVREAEFENGEWRYQVWTARFTVVVSLDDDGTVLNVCTCWRNQP